MLSRHEATPAGCVVMTLICLFYFSHLMWDAWAARKAGMPVDWGDRVRMGIAFLLMAGLSVYDAVVHS